MPEENPVNFDLFTNAAHPLRSKRIQGFLIMGASIFGGLLGFNITEPAAGDLMGTGNQILTLIGIGWNQIGGMLAKTSPRAF